MEGKKSVIMKGQVHSHSKLLLGGDMGAVQFTYCIVDRLLSSSSQKTSKFSTLLVTVWIQNVSHRFMWQMLSLQLIMLFWEDGNNFRKRGLDVGNRAYLWRLYLVPHPFLFLFMVRWRTLSTTCSHYHHILPQYMGLSNHGLNPLKPGTKINLSSFKLFLQVFLSQLCKCN
jgi:hypothetical protein